MMHLTSSIKFSVAAGGLQQDAAGLQRRVLIELLERSLAQRHARLAMRRYLMLIYRRHEVPEHLHAAMERIEPAFAQGELDRIEMSVLAWALMLDPPWGSSTKGTAPRQASECVPGGEERDSARGLRCVLPDNSYSSCGTQVLARQSSSATRFLNADFGSCGNGGAPRSTTIQETTSCNDAPC